MALCFIVGEYNCAAWELNFDYFFVLKPKFSKWARRKFQKVQQATRNKMEIDWSSNYNPKIIILFLTKYSCRKKIKKSDCVERDFLCQFRQFWRISPFSVNIDTSMIKNYSKVQISLVNFAFSTFKGADDQLIFCLSA